MSAKPITKSATKLAAADRKAIALMRERPDLSFLEAWKLVIDAEDRKWTTAKHA